GENEATLIIGENGYTWEREERLTCRYLSGKARFDSTIPASTKTVGVWVFHIIAGCIRTHEGAIRKYTHSFRTACWVVAEVTNDFLRPEPALYPPRGITRFGRRRLSKSDFALLTAKSPETDPDWSR